MRMRKTLNLKTMPENIFKTNKLYQVENSVLDIISRIISLKKIKLL